MKVLGFNFSLHMLHMSSKIIATMNIEISKILSTIPSKHNL